MWAAAVAAALVASAAVADSVALVPAVRPAVAVLVLAPLVLADPLRGLAVEPPARAPLLADLVAHLVVPARLPVALLVLAPHPVQARPAVVVRAALGVAVPAAAALLLRPSLLSLSAAMARSSPWPAKFQSSPEPRSR